jgi:putative nucleotidyltransferase with HDIG domain
MQIHLKTKIFSSKISKRIFATFMTCALTPVVCLAILVYFQVTRHLQNHAIDSLRHEVKTQTLTLFERLNNVEKELELISFGYLNHTTVKPRNLNVKVRSRLLKYFKSITFFINPHRPQPILNQLPIKSLPLTPDDIKHLSAGRTLLVEMNLPQTGFSILMLRSVDAEKAGSNFLAGELNLSNFWANDDLDNLPLDTKLCILDSSGKLIYSSQPGSNNLAGVFKVNTRFSTSRIFEFSAEGEQYIASYSQMFLKPNFKLPHWNIILYRAKSDIFAPLAEFKIVFPLLVILTLLVVLRLSIANIRKNLVPIVALKRGVGRIAKRDFSQKVSVSSNDEFEELAVAFNAMSDAVGHKFKTLAAKANIDRAVLSTFNRNEIIQESIKGITRCINCHVCGLSEIEASSSSQSCTFYCFGSHPEKILTEPVKVMPRDHDVIAKNHSFFKIYTDRSTPKYLPSISNLEVKAVIILPVWVKKKMSAILWLGFKDHNQITAEDITLARQLGDQVAVALSNSSLVEDLKEMNWGTLHALARTVDAKSPWTAGHSQRVSELALKIGSFLQLRPKALEELHRAALLHDIGKVGIPSDILDKPSKLSEKEFQLIKSHPQLGANIIKPINAYKTITPIIAQHHERFDGQGYPEGLAGEAIHHSARILSVADVYDSLSFDRPYRVKLAAGKILEIMQNQAGRQFDPEMVKALFVVIAKDQKKAA